MGVYSGLWESTLGSGSLLWALGGYWEATGRLLEVYSLGPPIWDRANPLPGGLLSGGLHSLGVYSLGVYCLDQSIWDLNIHLPVLGVYSLGVYTLWGSTLWGSTR